VHVDASETNVVITFGNMCISAADWKILRSYIIKTEFDLYKTAGYCEHKQKKVLWKVTECYVGTCCRSPCTVLESSSAFNFLRYQFSVPTIACTSS
jgi:hypothetical protein